MAYNFSGFKDRIKEATEHFTKELSGVRTGRATPTLLDGVVVESYGSRMPIYQVANIGTEDARTLRISPWDATLTKAIEKAITEANLGISASVDERGLRVFFPELTEERRTSLIKIAKDRLEDARVALRQEREKTWKDIQEKEKAGDMSEDDKFRSKEEMEKLVAEANKMFDAMLEKKEAEIRS